MNSQNKKLILIFLVTGLAIFLTSFIKPKAFPLENSLVEVGKTYTGNSVVATADIKVLKIINDDWVYAEVTRKSGVKTGKLNLSQFIFLIEK